VLPDVIFSYQKSHFAYILGSVETENIGIFYCHFVANWYNFDRYGILHEEKSGNPESKMSTEDKDAAIWMQTTDSEGL
jgi:hypothetical protein